MDATDQKVLKAYCDSNGRIKQFPTKQKKLAVILRHVLTAFDVGVHYSEKRVNEILSTFNEDTAFLRRALIEFKMMARQGGGGLYQVVGLSEAWVLWPED